jgi:hypothetical protein
MEAPVEGGTIGKPRGGVKKNWLRLAAAGTPLRLYVKYGSRTQLAAGVIVTI